MNAARKRIILAGGFVRHPVPSAARLASRMVSHVSPTLLVRLIYLYARIARIRYRYAPEVLGGIEVAQQQPGGANLPPVRVAYLLLTNFAWCFSCWRQISAQKLSARGTARHSSGESLGFGEHLPLAKAMST